MYTNVYRTLQRIKKGVLPKNPNSVREIEDAFRDPEILKTFGYAHGSDDKFFDAAIETNDFSYCVFSSKKIINLINTRRAPNKRHILLDATFKTVPFGPFKQLLIFYVRIDHQVRTFFSLFLFSFLLSYPFFFFFDLYLFSLLLLSIISLLSFLLSLFFSSFFSFFFLGFSFCFLSYVKKKSSGL